MLCLQTTELVTGKVVEVEIPESRMQNSHSGKIQVQVNLAPTGFVKHVSYPQ
jgi:hypothetical protein